MIDNHTMEANPDATLSVIAIDKTSARKDREVRLLVEVEETVLGIYSVDANQGDS